MAGVDLVQQAGKVGFGGLQQGLDRPIARDLARGRQAVGVAIGNEKAASGQAEHGGEAHTDRPAPHPRRLSRLKLDHQTFTGHHGARAARLCGRGDGVHEVVVVIGVVMEDHQGLDRGGVA